MEAREHSAVTQECQPMSMHGGDLIHPITHLSMSTGALSTSKVRGTHELSARIRLRRKMISQQLPIRVCDGTPPSKRSGSAEGQLTRIWTNASYYRSSFCRFDKSRLANHRDFDFAGIGQLCLKSLGNFLTNRGGLFIGGKITTDDHS